MKRINISWIFGLAALLMLGSSCDEDPPIPVNTYKLAIPEGFPEPEIPEDNPLTEEKIELGRMLFYDPILSEDSSISCASCHFQENAFSDITAVSDGFEGRTGMRNSPPLINLAWVENFFHDGGIPTLELQILAPIDDEREMASNMVDVVEKLQQNVFYSDKFMKVFGTEPSAFGLTRSIAAFERTLISGNSPYDQYTFQGKTNALTESEKRGMGLFFSTKTKCASCHVGFNFTDESYRNVGLYEVYADTGRERITLDPSDKGKFRVPTLRNVEVTGPYMHDGSMNTLEEIIDLYAAGGENHPNKDPLISGFSITEQEKQDLVAFLKSLTDQDFLTNPAFSKP